MTDLEDLFAVDRDTIDVNSVEFLALLCKYHPRHKDKFMTGLKLAEDLVNDQGVTLYTSGTSVTLDRVARLVNLHDNNPNMEMKIKIQRSAELLENFKKDIVSILHKLMSFRKNYKVYASLLASVDKEFRELVSGILSDENALLNIYKMKFSTDNAPSKNASVIFHHAISVSLFSFAVARQQELSREINFAEEDLTQLTLAAFFHNMGAVINNEVIFKVDGAERVKKYLEANRHSAQYIQGVELKPEALEAIQNVSDFNYGRTDFIHREENKADWMSNIILIVDRYLQLESGLFGIKKKPSHIIDMLNVQAMNGKWNKKIIKALTIGLNLKDMFDFYQEMDYLRSLCKYKNGGHAWPYPLTGFKSPTLFICKSNLTECEYYETSLKAIKIVKPLDELDEGKYARCLLTTPKLIEFYMDHYSEIKNIDDTQDKD